MSWTVTVHGDPVPQGSKTAPTAGRVVDVSGARLKAWRHDIGWNATAARNRAKVFVPADGPVALDVVFRVPAKGAGARAGFPAPVTPDTDKLLRAVLDALTGVAYGDDRQVTEIAACKRFPDEGEKTGVTITVRTG